MRITRVNAVIFRKDLQCDYELRAALVNKLVNQQAAENLAAISPDARNAESGKRESARTSHAMRNLRVPGVIPG